MLEDPREHLHLRAARDLAFIREAMSRSAAFTSISGKGSIIMGLFAAIGTYIASLRITPGWWLAAWMWIGLIGALIGLGSMVMKARRSRTPLLRGVGRRFLVNGLSPILAGGFLTVALYGFDAIELMPGTWLLLYGTGLITGGAFSVRIVPITGICFVVLGVFSLVITLVGISVVIGPLDAPDIMLAMGFGALHIASGIVIAKNHGG